ncbi:glycosyltransferase family 2 protein [Gordonibacter massiliensis (ex Traore et al. 2017)]|uniref:glycosyltransferase family 2 protein n=1 Tax=Gordonibacter massiliensis (ex Traore et al. 2017) TaxID=1841863 RepID=UPI001C8B5FC6|nr:glycosyltransferase [Gordonibacter massiliensis (ex Traore et al. 2017)]MBX9033634.1 glycosyltransferase [Gordonibacter massiliensis (ex Traore et al. 2017)]
MEEKPLVSIVVSVYNHARYIEECLRGIAAQTVDFPIEVLVADDCSPDGTADVLRALEPELPNTFTLILREQNLGAVKNGEDLYARATGKYLVDLEGDDFWTYEGKLQAQVEFLEGNPEYSAVYTRCTVVGADSKPNGEEYPQCSHDEYTFKDYFYSCLPGQSGTLVCRREQYVSMREEFMGMRTYEFYPGDRRNAFLFLVAGKVRCIQENWSAYRHVTSGGSSYSSTVALDDAYALNEVRFGETLVAYAQLRGDEEAVKAAKKTYYRTYLKWACDGRSSLKLGACLRELMGERNRLSYLASPVQWYAVLGTRMLMGKPVDL